MKKILTILLICSLAFAVRGQVLTSGTVGSTGYKNFWYGYTGGFTTSDSMAASGTYYVDLTADLGTLWAGYDVYILLDSVRGNPAMKVSLQAKWTTSMDFVTIDSLDVGPLKQEDTAFVFTAHSSQYYNYLRLKAEPTATAQRSYFNKVNFKIWKP